ncbi:MAG: sigma-70 family RNA polymerase sigma factor [Zavarzinella sp.]
MNQTSISLLDRLHQDPQEADWRRLVEIYTPLIRTWLRKYTVPTTDTDDLVQEVIAVLVRRLPDFEHNSRTGAFRTWLRSITFNCLRDFWKAKRIKPQPGGGSDFQDFLQQMADPNSFASKLWDAEHDKFVLRRLMTILKGEFSDTTWRAFELVALEGKSADEVAEMLGISTNAVFIAKSRILTRLRQEAKGMLEEE